MKDKRDFPKGWDAASVQAVIDHHENQTGEEECEEFEALLAANKKVTLVEVPNELVMEVRALIARKRVA